LGALLLRGGKEKGEVKGGEGKGGKGKAQYLEEVYAYEC